MPVVNSRTVELENNLSATAVGAAAPGVIWEWVTDLRAGGGKAVAESLLLEKGEEDGAGWEQHMGLVGQRWTGGNVEKCSV